MSKVIRVRPVATAMVPDFRAQQDGVFRFVGKRHLPKHGRNGAFAHLDDVVELDIQGFEKEYLDEVRAGALVPADEASARMCGVKFQCPVAAPEAPPAPAADEDENDISLAVAA